MCVSMFLHIVTMMSQLVSNSKSFGKLKFQPFELPALAVRHIHPPYYQLNPLEHRCLLPALRSSTIQVHILGKAR